MKSPARHNCAPGQPRHRSAAIRICAKRRSRPSKEVEKGAGGLAGAVERAAFGLEALDRGHLDKPALAAPRDDFEPEQRNVGGIGARRAASLAVTIEPSTNCQLGPA